MHVGYIYKCTHIVDGKLYIGQKSSSKFISSYYGRGSKWIKEVLFNYRRDELSKYIIIEVLEWCTSYEQLNKAEKYWIKYYDTTNPNIGYNVQKGGNANNEMYKANMSKSIQHVMQSEEVRSKISTSLKQYKQKYGLSDQHRQNLSNALKGTNNFKEHCDSRNIAVYCIVDSTKYTFKSKRDAAIWWYKTMPFTEKFAEITYVRKINDSINSTTLQYKGKPIQQSIKWYLL